MSRTFRRKRGDHCNLWWATTADEDVKKAKARYHSDAFSFMGNAPKDYARGFSKQLNTFNNRQLQRWLGDAEFPVQCIANHRHSANYGWR